jgi:ubiquinone/menaquinone biosynthesis C-methylase UbiE
MSGQLRFLLGYEQLVKNLLGSLPEDEAAARAVGGDYERYGVLEHALLRGEGLRDGSVVIDVGCGSGRLATKLARYPALRYLGLDVVPELLDYARRKAGREDFRFERVDAVRLPVEASAADFCVFFSVFTHILPEESYVYLEEAHRVLKPGGKAVFSFLEHASAASRPVFEANLAWVRERHVAGHLNTFLHRADLRAWAERIGFEVAALHLGESRFIEVDAECAAPAVAEGLYALGQSVCVLRKRGAA